MSRQTLEIQSSPSSFVLEILGTTVQWAIASWHSFQISLQYEYSLPVHPPPLPSQPSLHPQLPGQKPFLQPTVVTAIQNTAQKGGPQPPVYQGQPPLHQEEGPMIQQQVAPSDKPPKTEVSPSSEVRSGLPTNIREENKFAEHISILRALRHNAWKCKCF